MSTEDLIRRLREAASAYPEDVFPSTTDHDREHHPNVVTRASAGMGRHFSPLFTAAADALEARPPLPTNVEEAVGRVEHGLSHGIFFAVSIEAAKRSNVISDLRTILDYLKEANNENP